MGLLLHTHTKKYKLPKKFSMNFHLLKIFKLPSFVNETRKSIKFIARKWCTLSSLWCIAMREAFENLSTTNHDQFLLKVIQGCLDILVQSVSVLGTMNPDGTSDLTGRIRLQWQLGARLDQLSRAVERLPFHYVTLTTRERNCHFLVWLGARSTMSQWMTEVLCFMKILGLQQLLSLFD